MKLSVIVPIYNGVAQIESMIHSVMAQRTVNWELILVDDGSTDGSSEICDKFCVKYDNIKVIHKPNGGVSSARNAGIEVATGEFIGFVDSDDVIKPDMYQKLIDSAEKHCSDLVMGAYEKVFSNGVHRKVEIPFKEVLTEKKEIKAVAWSMAFWNGHLEGEQLCTVYGSVWPNLYRRDIIQANHIRFPEKIKIGEDLLFNLDYIYYSKCISVVNESLYEYIMVNSSATRKKNDMLWKRYITLLDIESEKLAMQYGRDTELFYNTQKQIINYAINVMEEQICIFCNGKKMNRELNRLCRDVQLQNAAKYIIRNGKTIKERIQAMLIRWKLVALIEIWLA